jgi:hypothetical protein
MTRASLWSTQLHSPLAPRASSSVQRPRHRRLSLRPACATNNGSAMSDGSSEAAPAPHAPAVSGAVHQPPRRAFATMLVHSEDYIDDPYGATMPPLYQTATFRQPGPIEMGEYDYNRSGNPTRTVLERQMADLEVSWQTVEAAHRLCSVLGAHEEWQGAGGRRLLGVGGALTLAPWSSCAGTPQMQGAFASLLAHKNPFLGRPIVTAFISSSAPRAPRSTPYYNRSSMPYHPLLPLAVKCCRVPTAPLPLPAAWRH